MLSLVKAIRPTLHHGCIFLLVALFTACGGGGDDSSSTSFGHTTPPDSGPGDAELFFPNSTGDVWYYDSVTTPVSGPPSHSMEMIAVTGQQTILGQAASVFQDTVLEDPEAPLSTQEYHSKNSGGVAFMGDNDPGDTVSQKFAPYVEALFPVSPATVASFGQNGVNLGTDLDGDGRPDTANLTLTAKVVDFEPLDTAIGSLQRTVKATESLDGTIILSSNNTSVPFTSLTTTWSAPGIGVVKRTLSVTVQGQTQQQEFDIRGYSAEGTAKGLTTPIVIASNLTAGSAFSPGPPMVASDGVHFLTIQGSAMLGLQGMLLDGNAKLIGTVNLGVGGEAGAGVSFDGTNYVVVINNNGALTLHRVTPAGADLDAPNGISLGAATTPGGNPAVASGNGTTLIAYDVFDSTSSQHLMYGLLVDHTGQVLPVGQIGIAVDDATHLFPRAGFDGTNYLVVWQQSPNGAEIAAQCHINAARVSPAGSVLDVPSISVSSATGGQFSPVVAFDGTNYFVAWSDLRNVQDPNSGFFDIYGARVSPGGQVLDGSGLAVDAGGSQRRTYQTLAYTGSDYLIAWTDLGYAISGSVGIRLARMNPDGTVTSAAGGIPVSGPPVSDAEYLYPVLTSGSQTAALLWIDTAAGEDLLAVTGYSL